MYRWPQKSTGLLPLCHGRACRIPLRDPSSAGIRAHACNQERRCGGRRAVPTATWTRLGGELVFVDQAAEPVAATKPVEQKELARGLFVARWW